MRLMASRMPGIHRILFDGTEEPRPPGNSALQDEIHGNTEHPLQILFEVHDVPPEGLVKVDQDIQVTLRALLVSYVGTKHADLPYVIPLLKVGLCLLQCGNNRPHDPVWGNIFKTPAALPDASHERYVGGRIVYRFLCLLL